MVDVVENRRSVQEDLVGKVLMCPIKLGRNGEMVKTLLIWNFVVKQGKIATASRGGCLPNARKIDIYLYAFSL